MSDLWGFDIETFLIQDGVAAPPLVCGSVGQGKGTGEILSPSDTLRAFRWLLSHHDLAIHNASFDLAVMVTYASKQGIDLVPEIFKALDREAILCSRIKHQLHDLANGTMGYCTRTGKETYYSLDWCMQTCFDKYDSKENDEYRKQYGELSRIPMYRWPEKAIQYPKDDAENHYRLAVYQAEKFRNQHDHAAQVDTAFCLQMGAVWGLTVDPERIAQLKERVSRIRNDGQDRFIDEKLLKLSKMSLQEEANLEVAGTTRPCGVCLETGLSGESTKAGKPKKCGTCKGLGRLLIKQDKSHIKKLVCEAYQCTTLCRRCEGTGKKAQRVKCQKCTGDECTKCEGLGYKLHKSNTVGCKACSSSGYSFRSHPGVPQTTPKARPDGTYPEPGIATGRDCLNESGDETLIDYAKWGELGKVLTSYVPWLERGITDDGRIIPLNPKPNVLVSTGRSSYSLEQQLPRDMGVRSCMRARDGMTLVSVDYSMAELISHSQSCLWIVGWSQMADALNKGEKLHDKFGAVIANVTYDHMIKNKKTDKFLGNCRNSAKPLNFGLPGLMGAVTMVLQQRKQGPDTLAPNGRLYKGLRFCVLMGDDSCGDTKVTEWGRRSIPPTCKRCIEIVTDLRVMWLDTFPENPLYFEYAQHVHGTGEIVQHVSKRIRGGATLCATANGFFQGLSADAMKHAVRAICREMYTDRSSPMWGSHMIYTIHDEILAESPDDVAPEAAVRISEIMCASMAKYCPDMVPAIEAEPALMKHMHKGAEPVYDDTGRLQIWKPKSSEGELS